ncbi:CDP-glycerol glycerophosphotransferase family protein [Paucisalibacillus globulus]|uniref:CDP-glycerol glycerophosphotransferase family protein n=1 Tax=Paucisalibacillus globulus TaxID=351095 RepID=UPI0004263879|nr:CDP-glycerol glycerophosphotransferase family protein [Paucisalibacillus globulus]
MFTVEELERQTNDQVVILKNSQCRENFYRENRIILDFETTNVFHWFKSIYHLATSDRIFVDNYYGFLAVTNFKENVICTQLWHAAGAIKQFALKDPSVEYRSERAYQRFLDVYHRFDYVVVGSEKMANIFRQSFDLSNDHILRTGIPRTDFFYDTKAMKSAEESLIQELPILKRKKVILYAPTFRDHKLNSAELELDIKKLYKSLSRDYVLFLRLHPAINAEFVNEFPGFVYNVSSFTDINPLLVITDILISDYSSIPFEFSLLRKPIVFYAYDLEEYTKTRGFWENYEELVPGPVVRTTTEIIDLIKANQFNLQEVNTFANQWNQYSRGYSSERLIQAIYKDEEQLKAVEN